MEAVVDRRFGLKVLAGILMGILVGILLLLKLPVGVQPGDQIELIRPSGETVRLTLTRPDGAAGRTLQIQADPALPNLEAAMDLGGAPLASVVAEVSRLSGEEFRDARVTARGEVRIRPWPTEILYVVGQIFMRLLRMLVVPLIVVSILVGIASLGSISKLGKIGLQAATWMIGTMFVAVLIGLTMVNLIQPGAGLREQWAGEADGTAAAQQTASDLILRVIPTNPVEAVATLDVVGMLFFTIIVAVAMLKIGRKRLGTVFSFLEGLNQVVIVLVKWIMKLAPAGIFALIAHTIGTQDVGFLGPIVSSLGLFALTVALSLVLHFLFQLIVLAWIAKVSPIRFVQMMGPALATAFGTNSSSATLPVTTRCVQELGVPRKIYGFVLPVGATLNMDGTALFEAVAVMFFAQAFAVELGLGGQAVVALTSVVAAMGAAGIPSAGLVTMILVLSAVGLPATKVPLLWAIDRPLDMMRTAVNVSGDSLTCCIVQRLNPDLSDSVVDEDEAEEEDQPRSA
ncbi:MAG: dicarboxylate/amino acid:cation symporter [Fimbriimonadaceae bacterium]